MLAVYSQLTILTDSIQTYSTRETLKIPHEPANQILVFAWRHSYWNFAAKLAS